MAKDNVYRNCKDLAGDCEYVRTDEYGTAYCKLDGIIQVEYFGCRPQDVIDKLKAKISNEE